MNYQEYKNNRQKEFNALPIKWAFSTAQFEKAMQEWGFSADDTDKIYALPGGNGGFYRKEDANLIKAYLNKPDELPELMKDKEFAIDAFLYEMGNHEYQINWEGDWDVCSCFGSCEYEEGKDYHDYLKEIGYGDDVIDAFRIASQNYKKMCDENGWW